MSTADLALLIILASFAANGLMQGMVRQLLGMLGFLLGLFLASNLYPRLAAALARNPRLVLAAQPAAFAVILLGVWISANMLGFVLRRSVRPSDRDWPDDVAGGLLGLVTGVLLLSTLILGMTQLGMQLGAALARTQVGAWLVSASQTILEWISPFLRTP